MTDFHDYFRFKKKYTEKAREESTIESLTRKPAKIATK